MRLVNRLASLLARAIRHSRSRCWVPPPGGPIGNEKGAEEHPAPSIRGEESQALTGLRALTAFVTGIVLTSGAPLAPAARGMLISSTPLSYSALMSLSLTPFGSEMWRSKKP